MNTHLQLVAAILESIIPQQWLSNLLSASQPPKDLLGSESVDLGGVGQRGQESASLQTQVTDAAGPWIPVEWK